MPDQKPEQKPAIQPTTRPATIEDFRITRIQYPRSRVIGDSQVRFDTHHIGVLELLSSDGETGFRLLRRAGLPPARSGRTDPRLRHRGLPRPQGGRAVRPRAPARPPARRQYPREPVRPGGRSGPLGFAGQGGRAAALPAPRRHRAARPRLRQWSRLPHDRRRVPTLLRRGPRARLRGAQDQGRPPRPRLGSPPPGPPHRGGGGRRDDHGRRQRGVVTEGGDPPGARLPRRRIRDLLDRRSLLARTILSAWRGWRKRCRSPTSTAANTSICAANAC